MVVSSPKFDDQASRACSDGFSFQQVSFKPPVKLGHFTGDHRLTCSFLGRESNE